MILRHDKQEIKVASNSADPTALHFFSTNFKSELISLDGRDPFEELELELIQTHMTQKPMKLLSHHHPAFLFLLISAGSPTQRRAGQGREVDI
jgi:hypothetical protein